MILQNILRNRCKDKDLDNQIKIKNDKNLTFNGIDIPNKINNENNITIYVPTGKK